MSFPKNRILCTEVHPNICDLIVIILSQNGFEVTCANDADSAIRLAKTKTFDLYLVDKEFPGVSGTSLSQRIREFDTKNPILLFLPAAYGVDEEVAKEARAQGYSVNLGKDDKLVAEVNRLLASV
jgi:DNA-binding response OmpR family regulator